MTMNETFNFQYSYQDDVGNTKVTTAAVVFQGGGNLYSSEGVFDVFCDFLKGAGFNPQMLEEAMEDL